ncbi:MAG: PrsW family glutamic-type intramembrane protease [Calditrichia bacterium]
MEYATRAFVGLGGAAALLIWAFIEEILKYLAAKKTVFAKKYFDEPIDAVIYMITAALGFASLENALFIFKSLLDSSVLASINTGSMRFIGATLLHTASSAIVGSSIAFSFFHKENRRRNVIGGILLAGLLHFVFNYFIMKDDGGNILKVLVPLWLIIIIIIFIFEKIKKIKRN